jgi:hypothetical protein
MQRHTTHYAAYDQYWETVTPRIVEWFTRHLVNGSVVVRGSSTLPAGEEIEYIGGGNGD